MPTVKNNLIAGEKINFQSEDQAHYGAISTSELLQSYDDEIEDVESLQLFEEEVTIDTESVTASEMTDIAERRKTFVDSLPRSVAMLENAATWAMTPLLVRTFTTATQAIPANVSEQVYRYWIASFFTLGALAKLPVPEFELARKLQHTLRETIPGYAALSDHLVSLVPKIDQFMGDKVNMTCSYTFACQSSIGHFIALLDKYLYGGVDAKAEKALFDHSETALNVTFSVAAVAGLCASACLTAYQAKVRAATSNDSRLRRMLDVFLRDVVPMYTFSSSVYYLALNGYETIMSELDADDLLGANNSIWVKLAGSGMGISLALPTALACYHRSGFQSALHSVLGKTLILLNFLFVINTLLDDLFQNYDNPLAYALFYGVCLAIVANVLSRFTSCSSNYFNQTSSNEGTSSSASEYWSEDVSDEDNVSGSVVTHSLFHSSEVLGESVDESAIVSSDVTIHLDI